MGAIRSADVIVVDASASVLKAARALTVQGRSVIVLEAAAPRSNEHDLLGGVDAFHHGVESCPRQLMLRKRLHTS